MAVLGDGGRLRHAAALAGVREAGALARALREMEILAEDEPFRFSHPIVRGAGTPICRMTGASASTCGPRA